MVTGDTPTPTKPGAIICVGVSRPSTVTVQRDRTSLQLHHRRPVGVHVAAEASIGGLCDLRCHAARRGRRSSPGESIGSPPGAPAHASVG